MGVGAVVSFQITLIKTYPHSVRFSVTFVACGGGMWKRVRSVRVEEECGLKCEGRRVCVCVSYSVCDWALKGSATLTDTVRPD